MSALLNVRVTDRVRDRVWISVGARVDSALWSLYDRVFGRFPVTTRSRVRGMILLRRER